MSSNLPLAVVAERARGRALFWRPQSGQTLLEMALLLPFLMILLLGVIEMGRYMYIDILIGNAARAGAAYGSLTPGNAVDAAGIVNAACNDFQNNLGANPAPTCDNATSPGTNDLGVTSSVSCGCDNSGTVTVDYTTAANCNVDSNPGLAATQSSCIPPTGTGHWGIMVTVQVAGSFKALFGYPGIPSSILITKTATMRVQ